MHKLLLSNTWTTYLQLSKYVYDSEYTLIHMNMSNRARILNMPESAEIYWNMDNYAAMCLTFECG